MRLIEVQDADRCAAPLSLRVGDLLLFHASGARCVSGAGAAEVLGPFSEAVVGSNGKVVTPMGPPNAVLVRARQPGRATVEVMTGDPWHGSGTTTIEIEVGP